MKAKSNILIISDMCGYGKVSAGGIAGAIFFGFLAGLLGKPQEKS